MASFYKQFYQTTSACGFTKNENLIRLQRSLKGRAREMVEAQLTIPSCVPQIIDTLKLLYGRPELLMEHYIEKIRRMSPPKFERLETVVEFAVAVQNLYAALQQANMEDHIRNPMLMKELSEKLPTIFKNELGSPRANGNRKQQFGHIRD